MSIVTAARKSTVAAHLQCSRRCAPLRYFFASSTDHSDLLGSADAHVTSSGTGKKYFLVPAGTPLHLAQKVDKLQLAWIHTDNNVIHSPKVVQKALGDATVVCGRLLSMALEDIKKTGSQPVAVATLFGLCKYVEDGVNGKTNIEALHKIREEEDQTAFEAVIAIATGKPRPGHSVVGMGTYRDGEKGWMDVAREFVAVGNSPEGLLYQSQGGKLVETLHMGDDSSDGIEQAGGAVAKFEF